jgi:hypothetical protein
MTCPCGSNLPPRRYAVGLRCDACQRFPKMHGTPRQTVVEASREFVTRQARARAAIEYRRALQEATWTF